MAKRKTEGFDQVPIKPCVTPEAEEEQMIALSFNLVKQRLRNGTASSQETTHFLKLGSSRARLECEKLKAENALLKAKKEQVDSQIRLEALYKEALTAMRDYSGSNSNDDEDEDEY